MNYRKLKGTVDILPEESAKWQAIENQARNILHNYQFKEIRSPLFEQFELFARGVGETSDIVSKEMYDFKDKGDRHLALRPEGTAGIVRAYVENKLYAPEYHKPMKLYYIGSMFRYERPQSGRQRQFNQLGVEVFGSKNPAVDVETMALAMDIFKSFNIKDLKLVINSLGDADSRLKYREALINYLEPHFENLSNDSKERLYKNPLRVLDSKNEKDKAIVADAPSILDFLNQESKEHFEAVKTMLEELSIPYEIDKNMVRGLDYYNDTIFEVMTTHKKFGSNATICAGGRYDGLVEEVGGPSTKAFGFGFGLERLILLLDLMDYTYPSGPTLDAYVVTIGEKVNVAATRLTQYLRQNNMSVEREFLDRKPGKQFKTADKWHANYVFTMGEEELAKNKVTIKNLKNGRQENIDLTDFYADFERTFSEVKNKLKNKDE